MKMYYVTVNNISEATSISRALLENQLAVCTNMFPIQCMYSWQGEIKEDSEIVLIIKTKDDMRAHIENVIAQFINYTHFIAEINVESVNDKFINWLNSEIKL